MSVREEPRLAASASTAALCGDLGTSPAAARSIAVPARNLDGDHNAPALIGDVCGRPFTGLVVVGGHGPNILTRIGGPRTRSNEGHDPVRGFLHSA